MPAPEDTSIGSFYFCGPFVGTIFLIFGYTIRHQDILEIFPSLDLLARDIPTEYLRIGLDSCDDTDTSSLVQLGLQYTECTDIVIY